MTDFEIRPAGEDDVHGLAAVYSAVCGYYPAAFVTGMEIRATDIATLLQTGHAFLIAELERAVVAGVRHREDEGIASFDLLASDRAGAGRALVAAVERMAQDGGIRLVRTRIPEAAILLDYFGRRGYTGISRESRKDGGETVLLEKRLPLLTVREQRRSDAGAIAALTGEDPWSFEQMARPGWFVASDGERVVGVISVRDGGGGLARIAAPTLAAGYGGRGLDLWMVERAAYYAETNGYHTAELPRPESLRRKERALEDRSWFVEGERYVRRFRAPPSPEEE